MFANHTFFLSVKNCELFKFPNAKANKSTITAKLKALLLNLLIICIYKPHIHTYTEKTVPYKYHIK